jgi:hypothetical protein
LFLTFFNLLDAQTDSTKYRVKGGFTFVPVEFPVISTDEFNKRIIDAGMPGARYSVASAGIGIQFFYNRFIYTFFNVFPKNMENIYDNYLARTKYSSVSFNIGYSLLKNYRFSLYPYIGTKYIFMPRTEN